jgi:hypothetical protein
MVAGFLGRIQIYQQRHFRARQLVAARRRPMRWSELIGENLSMTIAITGSPSSTIRLLCMALAHTSAHVLPNRGN